MRSRTLTLAWLGFGLTLAPALTGAARADVATFAQSGGWEAFGGAATDGRQVCGLGIHDTAHDLAFVLKWFSGDHVLTLQAMKRSWSLPPRAAVPVTLRIDAQPVWTSTALGSGHTLEWVIGGADIRTFEKEFRTGTTLLLQVRSEGEPVWQASLAGSEAMAQSMVTCMKLVRVLQPSAPERHDTPATGPVAPSDSGTVVPRRQRVT